jgi:peptidoglycan/LPS O-acetylase OafA/YrhL
METLEHVVVVVHLLGWAALFGGMVVQLREPTKVVNPAMRDGIGTAFVAGLLVVGLLEAGDEPVNHAKVAVKFTVGLVVLVLVMANLRKERLPDGLFYGILALTVLNVGVAVLW